MRHQSSLKLSTYQFVFIVLFASTLLMLLLFMSFDGSPTQAAAIDSGVLTATPFFSTTSADQVNIAANATNDGTPTITLTPTSTGTITATATFTGTLTAIPRVLIQVVADVGIFRTGPSRVFGVVATVKRLNKIELSGISTDGLWYMFMYGDPVKKNTWISADKTITTVLTGDPSLLPVVESPPTPMPRATSSDDLIYYNPLNCVFYSWMSEEQQDQMVQQLQASIDANDWLSAGNMAKQLYRCPLNATFYLLYTQDVPAKTAKNLPMIDWYTALDQFTQGWTGKSQ